MPLLPLTFLESASSAPNTLVLLLQPPLPWAPLLLWPKSLIVGTLLWPQWPFKPQSATTGLGRFTTSVKRLPRESSPTSQSFVSWTLFAPLTVSCNQSFIPSQPTSQIIYPRGPIIDGNVKELRGTEPPTSGPTLQPVVNRCSAFSSLWWYLRLLILLGSQWEMMFLSGAGQQNLSLSSMDNEKAPRLLLSWYFAWILFSFFLLFR